MVAYFKFLVASWETPWEAAEVELMLSMRGTNPATVKDCKEQRLDDFGSFAEALHALGRTEPA